jgi:multicomponent Na+:H+ antiporter subunit D
VDAGQLVLLGALMLSTLLNIGYLLVIPMRGFFSRPDVVDDGGIHEAPLPMLIAMVVTALATLGLFFFPGPLYRLVLGLVGQ